MNPLRLMMICVKIGWNCPSISSEDFEIASICFRYFVIISPWEKAWSFIWIKLNPLQPGILCARFGLNWPSVSPEKKIFKFRLWEWSSPTFSQELEFPSPKDAWWQVWLKLAYFHQTKRNLHKTSLGEGDSFLFK